MLRTSNHFPSLMASVAKGVGGGGGGPMSPGPYNSKVGRVCNWISSTKGGKIERA